MQLLSPRMGVVPFFPKKFIEVLEEVETIFKKRVIVLDLAFVPTDLGSQDIADLTKICDMLILYRHRPSLDWNVYPDGSFNDYTGFYRFKSVQYVDCDDVQAIFARKRITLAEPSFPNALAMSHDFGFTEGDAIGESYAVMHFAYRLTYMLNNYFVFARNKPRLMKEFKCVTRMSRTIYIGSMKNNMAIELENKKTQAQNNIATHERALMEAYRKLREANEFVIPVFSYEDITKRLESVEDEFDVTFPEPGVMNWTTKKLQFVHINKGKLPIGRIEFGITSQGISYVASVECPSGVATPHSNSGGGICFGGFGATAIQAVSSLEFHTVKVVLLEWIKSYNPGSIYTNINTVMHSRGISISETDWQTYAGAPADEVIGSVEDSGDDSTSTDTDTNEPDVVEVDGLIMPTRLRG